MLSAIGPAPTVPKEARRGPAMRTWSGAARYGRSSGSPRLKSGAKVRFLVDPTIGWRRHEWRFWVDHVGCRRG
jgi:hypothetical protein